jgi:hypothetical protein
VSDALLADLGGSLAGVLEVASSTVAIASVSATRVPSARST